MRQMLCTRLIGRDDERQILEAAIHAARNGRGGGVFLLGEAGVGKSRLAREAEDLAERAGMRVLRGRSIEMGAAGFRPLTEALLSAVRRGGADYADRPDLRPFTSILARLIPDWRELGVIPTAADDSLVLLSEAVLRFLRAVASSAGCLLVLEDLHWADGETLAVLDYLIANAPAEPFVVLATSRAEVPSPALDLARSLAAHRTATVLELRRLPPAEVREMASACLGEARVPEPVERLLSTSAEGLPLLVEDLLAEWVGASALVRSADGWDVRHVIGPVVPVSFVESVQRRLQVLGAESTRLVLLAALLGRHFDWTLLPPASGLDDERVLGLLHSAVDAQLLQAESAGFSFRHALTREAALDRLSPVQRARDAARLLAVVEGAHPHLDGEWCELAAALADTAGDRSKAATLLLDSARRSLTQGALATAETLLERARALAPTVEVQLVIDETLLHALSETGKADRVSEIGEQLLTEMARDAAPPLRMARVHLSLAQAAVSAAGLSDATQHLELARKLDASGELEARIDALAAHVAIDEHRADDAGRLARAALAAAERSGETAVACEALIVLGRLARNTDLDRAEEAFEQAHRVADAHGLTIWRSRALHELGTIDMFRDCSPRRLLEARELAERSGALATVASVDVELAAVYVLRFELDQAYAAAQRAVEAGRRFRLMGIESAALLFVAEVHAMRQDRIGMERVLAELPTGSGDEAAYFNLCRNGFRGELSLCEENRRQALKDFAAAVEIGRRLRNIAPSPSFGESMLLWSLETTNRTELPQEYAMVQPVNRGFAHYARAIQLGRQGHAQQAAEAMTPGDHVLEPARWYFNIGRRLVAEAALEDGWGEPVHWLRDAEAFSESNGYRAVASACRSLLRRSGERRTPGRTHAGVPEPFAAAGVTERELEVLAALPDGLSNKQIAARLYLSPKTVEKHIASLMDKLEVRSRTQLAAIASAKMGDAAGSNWGKSRL